MPKKIARKKIRKNNPSMATFPEQILVEQPDLAQLKMNVLLNGERYWIENTFPFYSAQGKFLGYVSLFKRTISKNVESIRFQHSGIPARLK